MLLNPNNPNASARLENVQAAARTSRQRVHVFNAKSESEIDSSFAAFVQLGVGALLVSDDPFFESQRVQLLTLAARHAVPAIYDTRDYTAAGGLMSYGLSFADVSRQVGISSRLWPLETSPLASVRQVLTFHTRARLSFAPSTCRMPLGQASGFPRADPGGRVTPRF